MLDMITIRLRCDNDAINAHRLYSVSAGRDLFGSWLVMIRNGRVGSEGAVRLYSAAEQEGARKIVAANLKRRLSAPKRIGAPYRITHASASPGINVDDWIPEGLRANPDAEWSADQDAA